MLKHGYISLLSSNGDANETSEVFSASESGYVADWDDENDDSDGGGVSSPRGFGRIYDVFSEGDDNEEWGKWNEKDEEDSHSGLPIRLQRLAICRG
jgi:hypothetical protein